MRKKLIVLTTILVSFIVIKLMMGTTEKTNKSTTKSSQVNTILSTPNDQSVTDNKVIVKSMSAEDLNEFQDELNRQFKELPTIGDMKNLTAEEVHHTPEIIKEGGGVIGRVFDEAEKNPKKRPDAMSFFKKCAEDQEIAIAIRAMCLNKVLSQVPKWQIPTSVTDAEISKDVFDLAMKLPR